jgi:hypothetical protein
MPRLSLLLALPLGLGSLGLLATAWPSAQGEGGRERSALASHMSELNGALRMIPKALAEEGGEAKALAELARVQKIVVDAKSEVPPPVAALSDEVARAAELAKFRLQLNALLRAFLDLEDAILKDDQAGIEKALAALGEAKDEGHAAFKPMGPGRK